MISRDFALLLGVSCIVLLTVGAQDSCLTHPWPYLRNTLRPHESLTADDMPLKTSTSTMVIDPELGLVMFRGTSDALSDDVIWTSNCSSSLLVGRKAARASVNSTGNLAVFDDQGHVCWESNTHFPDDASTLLFVLQDDCNFALYRQAPYTDLLWSSGTAYCLEVHLVPHSHDDVGWLMTPEQYFDGCQNPSIGVNGIISTVVEALALDPSRTFTQVEMYFFNRWWELQSNETRETCRRIVESGQLTFTNAGWSMSDEACVHQESSVANWEIGAQELEKLFADKKTKVSVGWHIDPFGHASSTARLMSQLGYDGFVFSRTDYEHRNFMKRTKTLETMWGSSKSLGDDALLFTSVMHENYCSGCTVMNGQISDLCNDLSVYRCSEGESATPPAWNGFGNIRKEQPQEEPLARIAKSLHLNMPSVNASLHREQHTLSDLASRYAEKIRDYAASYRTHRVLIPWGCDFSHHAAVQAYADMDAVMHEINSNLDMYGMRLFYSTPAEYVRAVQGMNYSWPVNAHDYFVDSDDGHAYWSGYFSSRAQFKLYERLLMNERMAIEVFFVQGIPLILQARGALSTFEQLRGKIDVLRQALGVAQHHDSITGTSIYAVRNHYQKLLTQGWSSANDVLHGLLAASLHVPQITHCPLANTSACPATAALERGINVTVVLLNALAWERAEIVTIPVPVSDVGVLVCPAHDISDQNEPSQWLSKCLTSVQSQVQRTWDLTKSEDPNSPLSNPHLFELVVSVTLPPLSTVKLILFPTSVKALMAEFVVSARHARAVSNDLFTVHLDEKGRSTHIVDLTTGLAHDLQVEAQQYLPRSGNCGAFGFTPQGQVAGAYIFRTCQPTAAATPLESSISTTVLVGPLCSEVRQVLNKQFHIHNRIRLCRGQDFVDVTTGMGPLPDDQLGVEAMLRFTTNISSGAIWFTDSQGLEMQRRERDKRPNYPYTLTEPIASNIFPANVISMINDSSSGFAVVSDVTRGVASMSSGQLELLFLRRLVEDDNRGVGEALDERIRVLSSSRLLFGTSQEVMGIARRHAVLLTHKPLMRFAQPNPQSTGNIVAGEKRTAAAPSLPPQVSLHSMEVLGPSHEHILIRLQHMLAVDELQEKFLSGNASDAAVHVDLKSVLPPSAHLLSLDEMDVSGLRPLPTSAGLGQLSRLEFRVCDEQTGAVRRSPTAPKPSIVSSSDGIVKLSPMEIRTYLARVKWLALDGDASKHASAVRSVTLRTVAIAFVVGLFWTVLMAEVGARAMNWKTTPLLWCRRLLCCRDHTGFQELPQDSVASSTSSAEAVTTAVSCRGVIDRSAQVADGDDQDSDATAMEEAREP